MSNIVESMRRKAIEDLFEMQSFEEPFSVWKDSIEEEIGEEPSYRDIFQLGDSLKQIFENTGGGGRGQSEVSAGGYGWEAMVCWYLNLCLVGTRSVVIKNKADLVPDPVSDAITVRYGSFVSNTEADLLTIIFPEEEDVEKNREDIDYKEEINELCEDYFYQLEVGIIQCKTNWKDNAQIPMLWGIIYSSEGTGDMDLTIGQNGWSKKEFEKFFYSFVTVPSNQANYDPNSTAVKRVQNLSGGNYWGKSTQDGVANSVKEIFNRQMSSAWTDPHKTQVNQALENENLEYFGLDFL